MPVALRSRPSDARVNTSASASKDDEKATDDSLSVVARDSSDTVKAAWASDAESKRGVVVGGEETRWAVVGKGFKRLRSRGSGKCSGEVEDGEEVRVSMIVLEASSRTSSEKDASDSSCGSSSWRRSVRVLSRARWLNSLVCAACLWDWILMEDDSCSRRRSRLRAYSRFYGAMVRGLERVRDDSKVNLQKQS